MTLAQTLLQTAATLIEEARKLTAPTVSTSTFFNGHPMDGSGWLQMLELWAKEDAARGKTPYNPELRAAIMGRAGGSFMPKSWSTHKRVLDAAERGELNNDVPWPGPDGKPFSRWPYMSKSTEEKAAVVSFLWNSERGLEWRRHPLNAHLVPAWDPSPDADTTTG